MPRAAPGEPVEQHRLEPVHRLAEARLRCAARLELVPQRTQVRRLVVGEQREQPVGRGLLAFTLPHDRGRVEHRAVAGVDLHQVVDDHQPHRVADVDRLVGVLGQQQHHQREVPGVLGVVLPTLGRGQRRRPQDGLELVDLGDERQLPPEPLVETVGQRVAIDEHGAHPKSSG
ncbi:hypothetical protein GCM10009539_60040 [Cryptosporangium japonicum]|uniref:Uncharacterized protein n=1 Tax=Cryptosporangium japonicum TaxID=80872 RepID=A0ABN0UY26_9ACTN